MQVSAPASIATTRDVDAATRHAFTLPVVRFYLIIAGTLTALVAVAPRIWTRGNAPPRPHMVADVVLGNWLWWDGGWYLHIAELGYSFAPGQQSSVAFFPVYPLAVRLVGLFLPGGDALAAVVITMLSGLATLVLFHRWCRRRMSNAAASTAVVALAVYPYAWFLYGAAYSDALFLTATLLAFLLLEDDRPVAAGLVGIVATASRPTGVVVLVGLVAVMLDRRGAFAHLRARIRPRDLGVGLAAAGIGGWCLWLALRFGHPFAFIETEGARGWDRGPGFSTWLKIPFIRAVEHAPARIWLLLVVQALMCVAFAATVPAVARRFGRGYAIYVATAVAVPALSTGDFMGTGRYILAAFPVFAVVGAKLADATRGRLVYFSCSATLLALGTTLFATGHLLA
jgi:hypothetical protein